MSGRPRPAVERVWAVVPAHDEAGRLGRCLDALDRAVATARTAGLAAGVVVVLDACTDGSDVVCAGRDVLVVRGGWRRVGAARAAGCSAALTACPAVPPDAVWLASTDADSVVPFDWLTHQVRLADRGAEAVRGTVDVRDWRCWPPEVGRAYAAGYHGVDGHPHVHGANLGVRASAYLAAGGFAPVARDEDVLLVAALAAGGVRVVASGHAPVATSARAVGRVPGGFSGHLRRVALAADTDGATVLAQGDGA